MKKLTDDIVKAFEKSIEAITIAELSIRTGVKISTLKRFVNRRSQYAQKETIYKLYPEIRRYILLKDAEENIERPVRIGNPPRMGHYLDELDCDEKILIDTFSALPELERARIIQEWNATVESAGASFTQIKQFSDEENRLLGMFKATAKEKREEKLMNIVALATEEMKRRREGV